MSSIDNALSVIRKAAVFVIFGMLLAGFVEAQPVAAAAAKDSLPCTPVAVPYFENFNSVLATQYNSAGSLPDCWDRYSSSTNSNYFPHVTGYGNYHYSPDGSASLTMTSGTPLYGDTKIVVLPMFSTPVSRLVLSFQYRMESAVDGVLTVGYVTGSDYAGTYVPVQTIVSTETITLATVSLAGAPNSALRLAIRWYHSTSFYSVGIDNVSVDSVPSSYTITVTSADSSMGTVTGGGTYTSGSSATLTATAFDGYHFVQWQDGDTLNPRTVNVVSDATYTATFAPNPIPCTPLSEPYFEDFNGVVAAQYNAAGNLPDCWDGYSNGTNSNYFPHVTGSGNYHYSPDGSHSLTMTSGSSLYGNTKIVVLPELLTPIDSLNIRFQYRMESAVDGILTVGYVTGSDFAGSFVPVQAIASSETMTLVSVSLEDAPASAHRIAFRWYQETGFYSVGIDNVSVSTTPVPYTITAIPADPSMGTVTGGGTYAAGSTVTLLATANPGYHFVQWQDGDTQNPRTVTVTGDSTYIATFAQDEPTTYVIIVLSSDPAMGSVSGGGVYPAGATATLRATPYDGFRFVRWQDNNTQNPRNVRVTGDITYIADFDYSTGIDGVGGGSFSRLYPNPATESTTLMVNGIEGPVHLALRDKTGRVVREEDIHCHEGYAKSLDLDDLPRGVYFLLLSHLTGSTLHKLIVE